MRKTNLKNAMIQLKTLQFKYYRLKLMVKQIIFIRFIALSKGIGNIKLGEFKGMQKYTLKKPKNK